MPELAEIKIMSNYINHISKDKKFTKLYHVEKGNKPIDSELINNFKVETDSFGKELKLKVYNSLHIFQFSVFMGMSGNWKFVPTKNWEETKFVRMRLDTTDGYSLLLFGGYMGPKYRIGGFNGVKRGPDPTKQFDEFKKNILDNINNRCFDNPLCDVLLEPALYFTERSKSEAGFF